VLCKDTRALDVGRYVLRDSSIQQLTGTVRWLERNTEMFPGFLSLSKTDWIVTIVKTKYYSY
jgi:hypothetical protein